MILRSFFVNLQKHMPQLRCLQEWREPEFFLSFSNTDFAFFV